MIQNPKSRIQNLVTGLPCKFLESRKRRGCEEPRDKIGTWETMVSVEAAKSILTQRHAQGMTNGREMIISLDF